MALSGNNPNSSMPSESAKAVTKSDSTVIEPPRALYIGGAGSVVVTFDAGNDVTFVGVVAGTILPIRPVKVKDATTATYIVALY